MRYGTVHTVFMQSTKMGKAARLLVFPGGAGLKEKQLCHTTPRCPVASPTLNNRDMPLDKSLESCFAALSPILHEGVNNSPPSPPSSPPPQRRVGDS